MPVRLRDLERRVDELKRQLAENARRPRCVSRPSSPTPKWQTPSWSSCPTWGESLVRTLESMGMVQAFIDKADFSGVCASQRLYVSDVAHEAFIDVNEIGTEAAAATGVGLALLSGHMEPPKVFRADHPFVFVIRDSETEAVLFLGRVVDPR